jgi:hypothetical protein
MRLNMAKVTIVIEEDEVKESVMHYDEGGETKTIALEGYTKLTIEASEVEKIILGKVKDLIMKTE